MLSVPDSAPQSANVDARRALGVRPGGWPLPQLEITHSNFEGIPPSPTLVYPLSPRSPSSPTGSPSASPRAVSAPLPPPSPTASEHTPSRFIRRPTIGRRPTLSSKKLGSSSGAGGGVGAGLKGLRLNTDTANAGAGHKRGLYETQKLLAHLLDRLETRDAAPDLLERAAIAAREVSGRGKGKGKGKVVRMGRAIAEMAHAGGAGGSASGSAGFGGGVGSGGGGSSSVVQGGASAMGGGVGSEDFDDRLVLDEGDWDTETTYDLVEQTRGLFVIAQKLDQDLFEDTGADGDPDAPLPGASPIAGKNKRRAGRFSSVAPPSVGKQGSPGGRSASPEVGLAASTSRSSRTSTVPHGMSGPALLARTLSVLRSLITVDCLHRTHLFRPKCPPLALQAACLDIASYMYAKGEMGTKLEVVGMVVEGFYGMGREMPVRVCEWLEGRVGEMLRRLEGERRGVGGEVREPVGFSDPFTKQTGSAPGVVVPTFAISTPSTDAVPQRQPSNTPGWMRYSPTNPSFTFFPEDPLGLLSIHSLRSASASSIQIAALVPRILLAVTSTIDLPSSKLPTLHRVHRLLSLILTAKPDSALDLLEIIAHATPAQRRTALEILATFFPAAVGHNTIARRLASASYPAQALKIETGSDLALYADEDEGHHFVPWRLSARDSGMAAAPMERCNVCGSEVHGFALKCSLCKEGRHLHCHRPRGGAFKYEVVVLSPAAGGAGISTGAGAGARASAGASTSAQTAYARFSACLPRLDELVLYGTTPRGSPTSTHRKAGQHDLTLVNLFTLALCGGCRQPLWGLGAQAYACSAGCQRFFHPECVDGWAQTGGGMGGNGEGECRFGRDVVVDEVSGVGEGRNPFTITLDALRASFDAHHAPYGVSAGSLPADLAQRSFDEMAVLHAVLWTQRQLLKNGITNGCIRVTGPGAQGRTDPLELRELVSALEEHLQAAAEGGEGASNAAWDYQQNTGLPHTLGPGYMFSDKYLAYCTALIRAPSAPGQGGESAPGSVLGMSGAAPLGHGLGLGSTLPGSPGLAPAPEGLLTPQGLPAPPPEDVDPPTPDKCYELLPLGVVTQTLSSDLQMRHPHLASVFLNHLRLAGYISLSTKTLIITPSMLSSSKTPQRDTWVGFTLPLLMDSSPAIESLVLAIEALLDGVDLAMNEQGLRLMAGRAWPSVMCSPYAMERLGKAAVQWVIAESTCTFTIVRDYATKYLPVPGLKTQAKGSSVAAVYETDRRRLMKRYVVPWLEAWHDLDPGLYAMSVYEQCKLADNPEDDINLLTDAQGASRMAGNAMENMTRVAEAGVVFSTVPALLISWLEDLGQLAEQDLVYRALPRLLHNNPLDIFALCHDSLSNPSGIPRVCKWLRVLAFSGVEIPWGLLLEVVEHQAAQREQQLEKPVWGLNARLGLSTGSTGSQGQREVEQERETERRTEVEARLDLVVAVNANGASIKDQDLAGICAKLGDGVFKEMGRPREGGFEPAELELIRNSMLLILKAYGVAIFEIALTSLGTEDLQTKQPASVSKKRRMTAMTSRYPLDTAMVLSAADLLGRTTCPSTLVLDFLWLLFARATNVDNVDGFLYHTCSKLYDVVWPLVDMPVDRRSRARVLLKLLSVNSAPLEQMVQSQLDSSFDDRAQVRERLLTFVLELADSSVSFELANWRASAVSLILLFFDVILDTREVIPDNLIILRSLLPTQLRAMSACFEEHLVKSSDERRLVLLARLETLRKALPDWPIVSWSVIEELMLEEEASVTQFRPARSSQTISALVDAQNVLCSLLSLGLEMLASGIPIPWVVAQRFQQHVAAACQLPWTPPTDGLTTLVLPALRSALDSSARILITGQTFETKIKKTAPVGSLFVPVVIDLGSELGSRDYLTQRILLDIMMVVFFKQNVRPVELASLSALQTIAEFVSTGECAENRLLALQVLQTAAVRMERESVIRAVPSVFRTIAAVLVTETDAEHSDSAVTEQSQTYLRTIVKSFGRSGLFLQLFRNDAALSPTLGKALQLVNDADRRDDSTQASLFDNVFRDLSDMLKRGRETVEQVLASLACFASTLEVGLSEDAGHNFGAFIVRLGKHVAEWDVRFDPNPILVTCGYVLDLVPPGAAITLLHQTSTVLHLFLSRFSISQETLVKLLAVSSTLAKSQKTEDTVRTVLFEQAGSAMQGLAVQPITLLTLLKFISANGSLDRGPSSDHRQFRVLSEAVPGCVQILVRTHPTFALIDARDMKDGKGPELKINIMTQTATVLCLAETVVQGVISQSLTALTLDAVDTQVNLFIFLLLASLDVPMGPARGRVHSLYPLLARAMALCLNASADFLGLQDMTGEGAEKLSLVFAVFRLSILALHDGPSPSEKTERGLAEDDAMDLLWVRIWPHWYKVLVQSLDATCVNADLTQPLRAVAHSVFFDTIIFLGSAQSPVLMRHVETLHGALALLVGHHEKPGGQMSSKMQKAAQVLDKVGVSGALGSVNRGGLVDAIRGDLLATERLRGLRYNR
ncbi:hypothetical protein IAT38_006499 [Cryptococcus sp. DSM 104549]